MNTSPTFVLSLLYLLEANLTTKRIKWEGVEKVEGVENVEKVDNVDNVEAGKVDDDDSDRPD